MRNTPRYRVRTSDAGTVTLTCLKDSWLGDAGNTRIFYMRSESRGYVWEESSNGDDRQVFDCLTHTGNALYASKSHLAETIRQEARAMLRAEERAVV